MKRVLSLTTTGLFVAGLALVPMSVRADQTVTGGKSVVPAPAASTATPGTASMATPGAASTSSGTQTSATVKKDDKKVITIPAAGGSTVQTPAKGS